MCYCDGILVGFCFSYVPNLHMHTLTLYVSFVHIMLGIAVNGDILVHDMWLWQTNWTDKRSLASLVPGDMMIIGKKSNFIKTCAIAMVFW